MTKDEMLEELYHIIETVSLLSPIPYKQFYEEHKNDSEHELVKLLRVGRQLLKMNK